MELRLFALDDAQTVAKLVGDKLLSKWTANIPYPYLEQGAIEWISSTHHSNDRNPYAIVTNGEIVGCVSYWLNADSDVEVGYWVGWHYWGQGICTAALAALLAKPDKSTACCCQDHGAHYSVRESAAR